MMEMSPCKGCTTRHTACHDNCEAYKEWRDRYQAQRKQFDANRNRWQAPFSVAGERRLRSYIKHGPGTYKGGSK